ncbi:MAG: S8 family serine peptidase [Chitinophagaceae bacterium]
MASPVVAGLAAFIMEYFPGLSPEQVKMVIEKSSQKRAVKVRTRVLVIRLNSVN